MASFLSSNGRVSSSFDNIRLKLSTHGYFEVRFHSVLQNIKILEMDFCDVITSSFRQQLYKLLSGLVAAFL